MGEQKSFIDIIRDHVSSGKTKLPPFDMTALKIHQELEKEEPSSKIVESLIIRDQALTGQVLKIANSAFYKGLEKVGTIQKAIVRLGMLEIANIVTLATQEKAFVASDRPLRKMVKKLWQHSVGVAIGAKWLAIKCGYRASAHEAFFAGLLHDIGKLFILTVFDDIKKNNLTKIDPTETFILETVEKGHTAHGYSLAMEWNLPEKYCHIVRDHHSEMFDKEDHLLAIVRLANDLCNKLGIGLAGKREISLAASKEVEILKLSEIDLAQLEIKLEDMHILVA